MLWVIQSIQWNLLLIKPSQTLFELVEQSPDHFVVISIQVSIRAMGEAILYPNFLEDKRVYNLVRAFWKRFFDELAEKSNLTYIPYINQEQNGELEYDGNPIFSAYVPSLGRAVRIIQVAPEEDELEITAWLDTLELNEGQKLVDELVIDLILSPSAKDMATDWLTKWFVENFPIQKMEKVLSPTE
jgi:hypothetical protein